MCQKHGQKFVNSVRKDKEEWAKEKPKLDNVRRLKEKFSSLILKEYKETIQNARQTLETSMGAAMPCKKRVTVTSSSKVTRAALYKEWRKLETISADQLNKVMSRNEVNKKAQKDKRKVHFATLMDIR